MKNHQKTKKQTGTNRNPQSRTEKTKARPQQQEQQQQNEPQDQQRQQQEQQQQNEPQDQQRQQQEQQQQNEPQDQRHDMTQEETETTRPATQNKGTEQTQAITTTKNKPAPDGPKEQKDPLQEPTTKNKNQDGGDVEKIKDPDPTIPEKRNDPVGGKNSDYSRTMNTPGKAESGSKGEFTDTDEIQQEENEQEEEEGEGEEEEEVDPVYNKEDQEKPGSFDPESDQKEAFGGEKKNTPDATKNKNGL
jgi:hypothetical protein